MNDVAAGVAAQEVFRLGIFPITDTIIMTWIVMAILGLFAYFATRRLADVPAGSQNYAELLIEVIGGLLKDMMGPQGRVYLPLIATLCLFVILSNLLGIIPTLKSPTNDLNTDLGLGFMVFLVCQGSSISARGLGGYLKSFFDPVWYVPIFFVLNVAGMLGNLISHSFRLFGNMVGGAIIMAIIFQFAPVMVPSVLSLYYDIFSGLIQGFIFFMLAIAYIMNSRG